ncbi:MAG: hypothetical protein M1472_04500 [Planctomycetes bacterium]|jgi:hypothetical protein|nr:hypothetical protein [Planctomycetota bacterium]
MQEYDTLKQLIDSAAEDISKAEGGNRNAGIRARKTMQQIRETAQNIRMKILELRGQEQSAPASDVTPPQS